MGEQTTLVGRPHWGDRFGMATVGGLFLFAGGLVVGQGEWLGIPVVLASLYAISELWRKVTVTDTEVRAQGRVSRRSIPLEEISEIGLSPMNRIWLHSDTREGFYLRMVSHGGAGRHSISYFFDQLGQRVQEHGGVADAQRRPHPANTAPWFSG